MTNESPARAGARRQAARPLALVMVVVGLAVVAGFAPIGAGEGHDPPGVRFSTFSLCAIDPESGESGVVVTTRVPFVGRAVPWVRAGVGAVATQSWTVVEYGVRGLDLMEQGMAPEAAIERLLADDQGRELRQLGLIDMQGRSASFTGAENGPWSGGRRGQHYTVQGNVLVGPEVVDAVAEHFESTEGSGRPLAERMILALEAGQAKGGDKRWGNFQSAAIRVADPNDPGRGGDHISLAIDVGQHATPVAEMKRIYFATRRTLGYRTFSAVEGPDVIELKRLLHDLRYWRPDAEPIPSMPEFDVDRSLMRTDPEAFQAALQVYRENRRAVTEAYGSYDAETVAAVDAFRKEHALDWPGNPPGLVDEALVRALRAATAVAPAGGPKASR